MSQHRFFRLLAKRVNTLALLSVLALLLGQLGEYFWFLELFSHFLPYYTAVFLLATCVVHGIPRRIWALCFLFTATWLVQPLFPKPSPNPQHPPTWRLLWYNVYLDNPNPKAEIAFILAQQSEMLALAEVDLDNPMWHGLQSHYPYGCEHQEQSPFALVVWSKLPLQNCEIRMIHGIPYIRAVRTDATAVYALHPPPPINAELAHIRQAYLDTVAARIRHDPNVLVVGDFNTSPFSPLFRRFTDQAAVKTQTSHYLPTWKPLGLNIDHVLFHSNSTDDIAVRALPWQASDHRPLLVSWYRAKNL